MLVAAVLRPQEREDGELEVVRVAAQQFPDSLELSVGETECAMERRFRHAAQGISVSAWPDHMPWVASQRALVLAADPHPGRDVGRLVPLHQGRGRRHPAGRDDRAASPHRRAAPLGYLAVRVGATHAVAELRAAWVPCAVLGVINAAVPMGLVAWGETHIDSSVAGIAQSTVPLFTFILAAKFLPHERSVSRGLPASRSGSSESRSSPASRPKAAGGRSPGRWRSSSRRSPTRRRRLRADAGRRHRRPRPRDREHARSRDRASPARDRAAADRGAGIDGARWPCGPHPHSDVRGPARPLPRAATPREPQASIVTYLIPVFALAYGALLLDEPVTAAVLAGFSLIVVGAVLASGQRLFGSGRRTAA